MNQAQVQYIMFNMNMLVQSMYLQEPVKMSGMRLDECPNQFYTDVIIEVVKAIETQGTTGTDYIVTFKSGAQLYADLSKCHLVRWAKERILLAVKEWTPIR